MEEEKGLDDKVNIFLLIKLCFNGGGGRSNSDSVLEDDEMSFGRNKNRDIFLRLGAFVLIILVLSFGVLVLT